MVNRSPVFSKPEVKKAIATIRDALREALPEGSVGEREAHAVVSENSIGGAMRPPADSGPVRRRGVRGVGSPPCRVARTAAG
jgi:hypothetical protein